MKMNTEIFKNNCDDVIGLMKALSNESRLMVVCALYKQEKCVGELSELIGLSQSALSQHLARFRKDNLVKTRRVKQTIYYSLNCEAIHLLLESLYDIYTPEEQRSTGKNRAAAKQAG